MKDILHIVSIIKL